MTALLVAVAVYTILGGMLSVLVTDYLQFGSLLKPMFVRQSTTEGIV